MTGTREKRELRGGGERRRDREQKDEMEFLSDLIAIDNKSRLLLSFTF